MNIQAKKLELVRLIIDTDNPGILSSIKRIFQISKKGDFWDDLTQYQKDEILKGLEEIENGETVDYNEFIKNINDESGNKTLQESNKKTR